MIKTNMLRTWASGLVLLVLASPSWAAISISFDYSFDTNNFFNTQAKKDVLTAAASVFESVFQDDLLAISQGGGNNWSAKFTGPGSGVQETVAGLFVPTDTLIVYAGGRALGGSTLGQGGPGGFSASGSQAWLDTIQFRGEIGAPASDFGPWGGAITFDTASPWNLSVGSGPLPTENDLLSVAIHELAHVLGYGTAASWAAQVSGTTFIGPDAMASFGGPVPLDDPLAHWVNGTTSLVGGNPQEAAMDPSITLGTRKQFTDLDFAGLSDIGWVIPEPSTLLVLGACSLVLLGRSRRAA